MARNIRAAKRLKSHDIPILLIGESGTGKERFARALHAASERAERPFVAVNCGSWPESALHTELFGRECNPATRTADERGRILRADGGTLFLDDIGDLPVALQAQLLHLLQEREVMPCGGTAIKVDVRIVCAARADLQEQVRRGSLRADLYYRLQGLVLTLPPLRARQDKQALIQHLFAQESAATPGVALSEALLLELCSCSWPGNIRQLRNVLRAMIALRTGDRLDRHSLPSDYGIGQPVDEASRSEGPGGSAALNALEQAERGVLLTEMNLQQGNITRVAHKLGVGRNTLYRKMRRLGIPPSTKKASGP
jgi:transcriptional regulator of acetoin/glycerol metabolism